MPAYWTFLSFNLKRECQFINPVVEIFLPVTRALESSFLVPGKPSSSWELSQGGVYSSFQASSLLGYTSIVTSSSLPFAGHLRIMTLNYSLCNTMELAGLVFEIPVYHPTPQHPSPAGFSCVLLRRLESPSPIQHQCAVPWSPLQWATWFLCLPKWMCVCVYVCA